MRSESGRSLIEIVGILAITGVMTASAIGIYNSIRHNQHNTIASAELRELAKNVKLLMGARGDYTGLSVDYLIKAGALNSDAAPAGKSWTVGPGLDSGTFEIKIAGMSHSECDFFAVSVPTWAEEVLVNGQQIGEFVNCFGGIDNEITFIAR
ncbi:MAG: hypothetical protein J6T57_02935 [Alphaproteobacteria bacterium]|nr:hypothetical protein [Alphaproteobacteria bacterium]